MAGMKVHVSGWIVVWCTRVRHKSVCVHVSSVLAAAQKSAE